MRREYLNHNVNLDLTSSTRECVILSESHYASSSIHMCTRKGQAHAADTIPALVHGQAQRDPKLQASIRHHHVEGLPQSIPWLRIPCSS